MVCCGDMKWEEWNGEKSKTPRWVSEARRMNGMQLTGAVYGSKNEWSRFAVLQALQLATTFPLVEHPPRLTGSIWSMVAVFAFS